jgi:hypothetical protein
MLKNFKPKQTRIRRAQHQLAMAYVKFLEKEAIKERQVLTQVLTTASAAQGEEE